MTKEYTLCSLFGNNPSHLERGLQTGGDYDAIFKIGLDI